MSSETPTESHDRATLPESAERLRKALRAALRGPNRASKALDAVVRPNAFNTLGLVAAAATAVRGANLGNLGLLEESEAVYQALEQQQRALRQSLRSGLMAELQQRAEAAGLVLRIVGEEPLTIVLSPMTIELNLSSSTAEIRYAREVVGQCELTADAVMNARTAAMTLISDTAVATEEFFGRLAGAYHFVCQATGVAPGARIDVVDLLAPLSLGRVDRGSWRTGSLTAVEPYPRYLLAYQLSRLRRDGMLARGGFRVELGTATGGSTRNKRDVLYVPMSPAEGQYYLSLRIVKEAS